ncbi:MAG TPA: cation-translocating P-type ATPase [Firmicutes bacterium]|nr:cation-translocating P-type ATPase [Candidatus Fermentithermobacillaceae bacterium]
MITHWHSVSPHDAARELASDPRRGLTAREAKRRLKQYGPNRIVRHKRPGAWSIFISQFKDPMVMTLLAATAVSSVMGEVIDAVVIAAIVVVNAALGTVQEYRAEKAIEALEDYAPPSAWVVRGGSTVEVERETVVPGDVLALWPGVRVPADARLIESSSLQVEEAALTGESLPVGKTAGVVLDSKTPLPDRKNMVFGGTLVTRGEGLALVVATGMDTEIGQIARMVQSTSEQKTPLEDRLASLGHVILLGSVAVCGAIAAIGIARGLPFRDMFLTGVSLAVAAVPEGLPAVVTLCLAMGVQRMARQGAVIRKLDAIETLGSVTVICSDKTGTLTRNQMAVAAIGIPGGPGSVRELTPPWKDDEAREALKVAVLASDARHVTSEGDRTVGEDPTEQALVAAAMDAGIMVSQLDRDHPRLAEKPFSSERRAMSVKVAAREGALICAKGAPDRIIPACTGQVVGKNVLPIGPRDKEVWDRWVEDQAGKGMRVLAVAMKRQGAGTGADYSENGLELLGCVSLADPVRPEAKTAVQECLRAGIRPVLVTGDHLRTAESVARQVGIIENRDGRALTGQDLDSVSEKSVTSLLQETRVFARVSPSHKLKIVRALQSRGHVVAMTGDGVNDAPALKEAAVGIAMGRTGTDVAREASAMVLADDNFATIVKAVAEGRAIYDNIRKFIRYLFSCNLGEVLVMMGAVVLGLPVPLSPTQLLWVNLVTDGLPALALSMDPPERGIMQRPPRAPSEGLFARGLFRKIAARGVYIGCITLLLFVSGLSSGGPELACTMAFATLVCTQLVAAFDCRSETRSPAEVGLFSNLYLVGANLLSFLMLVATIQVPAGARLFGTVPLSFGQWVLVFAASVFPDVFRNAFSR